MDMFTFKNFDNIFWTEHVSFPVGDLPDEQSRFINLQETDGGDATQIRPPNTILKHGNT